MNNNGRNSGYKSTTHAATIDRAEYGINHGLEWGLWLREETGWMLSASSRTLKGMMRTAWKCHGIHPESWKKS